MDTKTSPNETKTEADTTDNMPVNLPKNGKARKKALLSIFIILSLILIVLLLGIYAIFRFGYFGKSSYVPGNDYSVLDSIPPETYIDENGDTHTKEEATLDSGLESSIISSQESVLESIGQVPLETGTYNLLLIGVDRRDTSWNGNSDTMILVTINYDRQTIYMTSFLRDLYANIPEKGVRKLNAAYAYGGAPLCMDTIRCNYGVQIDNYAMVDFSAMIEIVDVLGGVDIELTEDEVSVANSYIKGMCRQFGESYEDHMLTGSGMLHLDGYQAVGYARNRYSGNTYDFGRTDRQRIVMKAIFAKAKEGGVSSMNASIQAVLPYVTHDVNEATMLKLLAQTPNWMNFEIVEQRIPYDNMYYIQNEILIPSDMEATITQLRNTIY